MKKMLIVVGPQGTGNHVWAKILGLHPQVYGWHALQEKYWIGHHLEPFAKVWNDPALLTFPEEYDNFVTSCSIPYVYKGGHRVPPILEFIKVAEDQGIKSVVAITSRDKNIIELQQERVRDKITLNDAYRAINEITKNEKNVNSWEHFPDLHFLSYESLYLWRKDYLKSLNDAIDFPIAWWDDRIDKILGSNANAKYIIDPGPQELDKEVKKACEASHYE